MSEEVFLISCGRADPHPDLQNTALFVFDTEEEARKWRLEIAALYTDWLFAPPIPYRMGLNPDMEKEFDRNGQEFLERARSF